MGTLAAALAALALAHSDHLPESRAPARTEGEAPVSAAARAAALLDRGEPGLAARLVAREAATRAEAARVLAAALAALGDPVGARIARQRAERLDAETPAMRQAAVGAQSIRLPPDPGRR
jgi:hypothetical protein